MLSPRERYENDASFHALVAFMVSKIIDCNFTPTEMREAAMLASIKYAEMQPLRPTIFPREIIDFLDGKIQI